MSRSVSPADAPAAKLRRVLAGNEVGVITLPNNHRILVDGRTRDGEKILVARLNENSAFCWCRPQYKAAVKAWLHKANGDIKTASNRIDCDAWPSRYEHINGDDE